MGAPIQRFASATATNSLSAYATGNLIGGQLTLVGLANGGFSVIYSVALIDTNGQAAAVDIFFFNQPLTSTLTDKAAVALNATDAKNCIGVVSVITADYASLGTPTVAAKSGKQNLFLGVAGGTDNNLYALLVARGAVTYTSASSLTLSAVSETTFITC